jgi:hypothetical protein
MGGQFWSDGHNNSVTKCRRQRGLVEYEGRPILDPVIRNKVWTGQCISIVGGLQSSVNFSVHRATDAATL